MYKALICDLDGTILDTIHTIAYYLNRALSDLGLPTVKEEDCCYFAGDGAVNLMKRALKSNGITDEETVMKVHAHYMDIYNAEPLYKTGVFPNVIETFSRLRERGVKLAVISNKQHEAVVPVVEHFFPGVFDVILGNSKNFPLKPHKEIGVYAMEKLGVAPSEVVYLGDTSTDMIFGKAINAGKNVGVLWGFRDYDELLENGADLIIDEVRALLELF